jgi:hypothetical protein
MRYTSAKSRPTAPFDANLEFRDSYAATSSAAAQVDSAAKVVDLGTGFWEGVMFIDVTAAAVDGGDEAYTIQVQFSDNSDFSTGSEYEGPGLRIGDAAVTGGDVDTTTGRYTLPFNNRVVDGTCLRYARVYTTHVGSTSSITFTAWAVPH